MSKRMGRNKLLLPFKGMAMVRHAATVALSCGFPVIVVLGHEESLVRKELEGLPLTFVLNKDYMDGQETSIRAGLGVADDDVLISPADIPFLEPSDYLTAARMLSGHDAARPVTKSGPAHPVAISRDLGKRITESKEAAKDLISSSCCLLYEGDERLSTDIDSPSDLSLLRN